MGAGASVQTDNQTGTSGRGEGTKKIKCDTEMSCETCSVQFNLFKKKKKCADCGRNHCGNCMIKEEKNSNSPHPQKRCHKCHKLSTGNFTRNDLEFYKIKDLRLFLNGKKVPTENCREKQDLEDLVLTFSVNSQLFSEQEAHQRHIEELQARKREEEREQAANASNETSSSLPRTNTSDPPESTTPPQASQSGPTTDPTIPRAIPQPAPPEPAPPNEPNVEQQNHQQETDAQRAERLRQRQENEMREAERIRRLQDTLFGREEYVETRQPIKRTDLDDVKEVGEIEELSIKQLKEILQTNFVDYKGCCEKWELIERVKRLWNTQAKNKEKIEACDQAEAKKGVAAHQSDVCIICMDAIIDCVLLECGHMLTCTKCGKRLAECPICRQFVVRVVHTFRA